MTLRSGPASLNEALTGLTVDWLRVYMTELAVPPPKPTRKADMVKAIARRLDDARLRKLWSRLDDLQQFAVAEAVHRSAGRFHVGRFRANHGRVPRGFRAENPRDFSALLFFLYPRESHRSDRDCVPSDLAERLRAFVPLPPAPVLETFEECPDVVERQFGSAREPRVDTVPLVRRCMEEAAAEDLFATLRLIDAGELGVGPRTLRPSSRTVERLGRILHDGDYFVESKPRGRWAQEVGPIRAHAWPWLVQAGGLAEADSRNGGLSLTADGRAAIGAPPARTLRRLWKRWQANLLLDEFNRVDEVKGQFRGAGKAAMTEVRARREVIVDVLAECPVGEWLHVDEFRRLMILKDRDFVVTWKPWRLYVLDPEYGHFGYRTGGPDDELEIRYILCFLFEYAATLGLLDVAFTAPHRARRDWVSRWGADDLDFLSRYDGLTFFRVNPFGAYCLGIADRYESSLLPAASPLIVLPDLRVRAIGTTVSASERLQLETYAAAEADGVWRLDLDRALTAVENGHDPAEFREFLAARDDQPLPERVEGLLRLIERGVHAMKPAVNAILFECADADIADRIAANPQAAKYCLRAGPRSLAVPARSEKRFRKAVHALGYALPPWD